MVKTVQEFSVFISCPSDVADERDVVIEAIEQINNLRARGGIRIRPVFWENDVSTELGDRPQAIVNRQIGNEYDVYLGIMCAKFGTATGEAASGTEEEFRLAFMRKQEAPNEIEVLFYFKDARHSRDEIDPDQFAAVTAFKKELLPAGVLGKIENLGQFRTRVLKDLTEAIHRLSSQSQTAPNEREATLSEHSAADETSESEVEDELGVFELNEAVEDGFGEVSDLTSELVTAMDRLGTRIRSQTSEIETIPQNSSRENRRAIERSLDRISRELSSYAETIDGTVPNMEIAMQSAMEAMQSLVVISNEDQLVNEGESEDLAITISEMHETLTSVRAQIADFYSSLNAIPRLTRQLRQSKRRASLATVRLMEFFDNSLTQTEELRSIF